MSFYIACSTPTCPERGIPKDTPDSFRDLFDAGDITCGECGEPVTDETEAAPAAVAP